MEILPIIFTMYDNYKTYVSSRILAKSIQMDNGCIEYTRTKHKYGLISITTDEGRKNVPAHRALWMAVYNCFDLPSNVYIRHKCDNPKCVNIDHLLAGTPKDNTQDCIERGRRANKYKLHTRKCSVSDDVIKAIRSEPNGIKQWYIAEKYGVSIGYVSKIRSMKAKTLIA